MGLKRARASLLAGVLLLQAGTVRAARDESHGPRQNPLSEITLGGSNNSVPLPPFDRDQVKSITRNLAQTFHQYHPKNWIELQKVLGAVLVNPTSPKKLPKFEREKVEKAVFQIANSVAARSPDSWEDFGGILNRFTDVIPASVMENIIAFQVLQKEANEKNLDKVEKENSPTAEGKTPEETTGKTAEAERDRLNPQTRDALDKQLDSNIGKFNGFDTLAKPAFTPSNGLAGANAPTASGKKDAGKPGTERNDLPSTGLNVFSTNGGSTPGSPPMIPVLSQNSPAFPNFPMEGIPPASSPSVDKSSEKTSNSSTSMSTTPPSAQNASSESIGQLISALVDKLTKNPQGASALPGTGTAGPVAKADPRAKADTKLRENGTRVPGTGPSGGADYGVAGVGNNEETPLKASETLGGTAEQWLKAALGLKDPESLDETGGSEVRGLTDDGATLTLSALSEGHLGTKTRARVVASLSEAGVSQGTAHRLYEGALYSAWGSTLGFLAYALRRLRRKRS